VSLRAEHTPEIPLQTVVFVCVGHVHDGLACVRTYRHACVEYMQTCMLPTCGWCLI